MTVKKDSKDKTGGGANVPKKKAETLPGVPKMVLNKAISRAVVVEKQGVMNPDESQKVYLKTGRAQAFRVMKLLNEYLEYKTIADIVDNEEYLHIPGVTTAEEYFASMGLSRTDGFRKAKIGRTLSHEELQFCAEMGLTRKDLIGYAALTDEQRVQIKDGAINLDDEKISLKNEGEVRAFFKAQIDLFNGETEALRTAHEKELKAAKKEAKDFETECRLQKERIDEYDRRYHKGKDNWLDVNRRPIRNIADSLVRELRIFVNHENMDDNEEARLFLYDLLKQIDSQILAINAEYKKKTGLTFCGA